MMKTDDTAILQAALVGYQQQLDLVKAKIEELQRRLGTGGSSKRAAAAPRVPQRKKHRISAAGRARIAAAQRKRWAASRK